MALTATATGEVQKDIVNILDLKNPFIFQTSFNRDNIFYEVKYKDLIKNPFHDLKEFIKSQVAKNKGVRFVLFDYSLDKYK